MRRRTSRFQYDEGRSYLHTCNCWTRECNYCSDLECAVKHDMTTSHQVISVTSQVDRTVLNSIVLYNKEGVQLGKFQWNQKGIYLTGCVACRTPRRLVKQQPNGNTQYEWVFSLTNRVVVLEVVSQGGSGVSSEIYTSKLIGECAEHYSEVHYFSFYKMGCHNIFFPADDMVLGRKMTPTCGGACEGVIPPPKPDLPPQPEWSCVQQGNFTCE